VVIDRDLMKAGQGYKERRKVSHLDDASILYLQAKMEGVSSYAK